LPLTSEAFGLSDVGKKRPHNEDALLMDPELGLYAVADGMGGHAAGEIASKRATEVLRQHILSNRSVLEDLVVDNSAPEAKQAVVSLVEEAIQHACSDIYRLASADSSKRGMGTTLVCLLVVGTKGVIGHVGDSRIYLCRAGKCHRLTEDHTLVAAQVKAGTLTKKQAATSQFRNVITRAVGIQESVQVDTLTLDLMPEDSFLLCSDGLHGYLEDDELEQIVSEHPGSELPKTLVALANHRGGRDNITVLVVSIEWDGVLSDEEAVEAHARMEMLRTMPLFRHLTYKEQTAVLSIATTQSFEVDEEIVSEGDHGDDLFIMVKGRVMIEKNGVQIAEVQTGGHFGEMGLVDNAPRSATVRAIEPTRAMVIPRADLMTLMKREPVLAVKMLWSFLQVLSDRLRTMNSDLSEARQELAVAHAIQPFAEE
jgi:serine/threonine protein phosphatase PrpC